MIGQRHKGKGPTGAMNFSRDILMRDRVGNAEGQRLLTVARRGHVNTCGLAHRACATVGGDDQLAILGATLSYAFAGVWGKTALAGQSPLMNALGMLVGSTVLMIPIVLLFDGPPDFAVSAGVWGALTGMAALSTALAYVLYFAILARAGAANLLLVTLLIPPFAISMGVMFLGEQIGLEAWIGFARPVAK